MTKLGFGSVNTPVQVQKAASEVLELVNSTPTRTDLSNDESALCLAWLIGATYISVELSDDGAEWFIKEDNKNYEGYDLPLSSPVDAKVFSWFYTALTNE